MYPLSSLTCDFCLSLYIFPVSCIQYVISSIAAILYLTDWWLHYLLLYLIDISPLPDDSTICYCIKLIYLTDWWLHYLLLYLIDISPLPDNSTIWYPFLPVSDIAMVTSEIFLFLFLILSLSFSTWFLYDIASPWHCKSLISPLPDLSICVNMMLYPYSPGQTSLERWWCQYHTAHFITLETFGCFFFGCFFISTLWYLHCLMLQLSVIATERPLSCLSVISTDSTITFVLCQLSTYDFIT